MKTCANCRQENPDEARFCLRCATPFPDEPAVQRVRKTVTILFCDMSGSTSLGERLDPESVGRLMSRYYAELKAVIEQHGGTVAKFIGDAVMGVFGIPTLHEDDALRAVRAAADVPAVIHNLNDRLTDEIGGSVDVRIGVNTGEVVAGDPSMGDSLITGDAVNVAARLEQAAPPGNIYIGRDTYRLVKDAVVVEEIDDGLRLKGKSQPLQAYRLISVKPGIFAGHERRMDSPMVGRQRQRQLLRQVFDTARQGRACHLFTLLGTAGVGKSRLVLELFREIKGEATILQGRCLPYGEGITFWPVVEVLRTAASVMDNDPPDLAAEKIRSFLADGDGIVLPAGFRGSPEVLDPLYDVAGLADAPAPKEQRFWAIRKVFEEMGKHRPLVVAFDDIHWAEPAFLDLLEYISDWARGSAILLLCMARPDLLDTRPGWSGGKFNATTILLEPLTGEESEVLVGNLVGDANLPPRFLDRVVSAAEGNPLYLEEILGMLIDDRILEEADDGRWVLGDLPQLQVPPTIQALIAARLDRLDPDERLVIERAAVIGKVFDMNSLGVLLPVESDATEYRGLHGGLAALVMALVRKDLFRPNESDPSGDGFQFRHLLIQETAYNGIPKETRARLHHRFADHLERTYAGRMQEYEEIVGHHLERASRYLRELGIDEDDAARLARRAAERLAAAGIRAHARADAAAATNLLARAVALLPRDDPRRMELLPFLGASRGDGDDLEGAEEAYREAIRLARLHGRDDVRLHGEICITHLKLATAPLELDLHDVIAEARDAIARLEGSGNDHALTLAWFLIVIANHRLGRFDEGFDAATQAIVHARAARQPRQVADAHGVLAVSAMYGSMPFPDLRELCLETLARSEGNPVLELWVLGEIGVTELFIGMDEEGQRHLAACIERTKDLGLPFAIAAMKAVIADVEFALGTLTRAEELYLESYALTSKIGDKAAVAAVAGALARVRLLRGDIDEAERYADENALGLPPKTLHFRTRFQAPRALIAAQRGQMDEARAAAADWLSFVESTDALLHRADAWMDVAELRRLDGDLEGARAAARSAHALLSAKGDAIDVARVERFLASLEGGEGDAP